MLLFSERPDLTCLFCIGCQHLIDLFQIKTREVFRHVQHMGGKENGHAFPAHFTHDFLQREGRLGVQSHERLVQHQQLRRVNQCGDAGQLLLHSLGIGADEIAQIAGNLKQVGIPFDALFPFLSAKAKDICHKAQVLDTCKVIIQIGIIWNVSGHLLAGDGLVLNGMTVDSDIPSVKSKTPTTAQIVVDLPAPL